MLTIERKELSVPYIQRHYSEWKKSVFKLCVTPLIWHSGKGQTIATIATENTLVVTRDLQLTPKGVFLFVCLFVWSDRCGCLDYCSGYTNSYITKTHTTVLYSMLILKLQLKSLGLPKALKKWCFRIVVLEKTLEGPLDSKEIKPVNPKGNQPWIFIGRTDAKAVAPILWSPDAKSRLIGKDPDAGKNWRQGEKRATEDEMVGWHHWLKRHEFEQILGDGEGQGSLASAVHAVAKSWTQVSHWTTRVFPGDPVAKTPWSQCRGPRFDP